MPDRFQHDMDLGSFCRPMDQQNRDDQFLQCCAAVKVAKAAVGPEGIDAAGNHGFQIGAWNWEVDGTHMFKASADDRAPGAPKHFTVGLGVFDFVRIRLPVKEAMVRDNDDAIVTRRLELTKRLPIPFQVLNRPQ
jgi:hypothetical protein